MKSHISTVTMTSWRKSLLVIAVLAVIAATFNGVRSGMYFSYRDVIGSFGAVAGILLYLLIPSWTAGDLSNRIGTHLILGSSIRSTFVARRVAGTLAISLVISLVFCLCAAIVVFPRQKTDWLAPFDFILGTFVYAITAVGFSFLFQRTIPAIIASLMFSIAIEPALRLAGLSSETAAKLSPETYTGAILHGHGGAVAYFVVIVVIVLFLGLSAWRGRQISL